MLYSLKGLRFFVLAIRKSGKSGVTVEEAGHGLHPNKHCQTKTV